MPLEPFKPIQTPNYQQQVVDPFQPIHKPKSEEKSSKDEKTSKLSLGESLKKGWEDFRAKIPNPFKASEAVGMPGPQKETSWRITRYIKSFFNKLFSKKENETSKILNGSDLQVKDEQAPNVSNYQQVLFAKDIKSQGYKQVLFPNKINSKEHLYYKVDDKFIPIEIVYRNRTESGYEFIVREEGKLKKIIFNNQFFKRVLDSPDEQLQGMRTVRMKDAIQSLPNYDSTRNQLLVEGNQYTPLTGGSSNFSGMRVASCGSSTHREIILLDPENSPILMAKYARLKELLSDRKAEGEMTESDILEFVKNFVMINIFHGDPDTLDSLLKEKEIKPTLIEGTTPFIPIDQFIDKGVGVCRHHSMVMAFLLDKLTKDPPDQPLLSGAVQYMRSNVEGGGAHAWVTYVNQNQKFHLDSLWNVFSEFSEVSERMKLAKEYGLEAIDLQCARAAALGHERSL